MKLQELLALINSSESVEKFAEDNLLKVASTWNRYILNYSEQILWTPRSWISHYCRWLTLSGKPWNYQVIAKAFDRFYHLHEAPEYLQWSDLVFDTNKPFEVQFKYDGSIILDHLQGQYGEEVHIQTRGSFCETPVSTSFHGTYRDLFDDAKKISKVEFLPRIPGQTFIWELCSPHNQVVDFYPDTFAVLLWIVYTDGTEEKDVFSWDTYPANSIDEVLELIKTLKPTQEWFVLAQWNDAHKKYVRIKCKTETWAELSHFSSWLVSKEGLWNVVFKEETSEVIAIFPHLKDVLDELSQKYHQTIEEAQKMYDMHKHIETQKDFAMAVKDHDFAPMMFAVRKGVPIKESVQKFLNR